MNRLAVDTNAVVDFTRTARVEPPFLRHTDVILPLPVVGELLGGARMSERIAENLAIVDDLLTTWRVLEPDLETARIYGRLRALSRSIEVKSSRMNDLWIAALCLQHDLPLLSNDRGFDVIPGLTVIHW